MRKLPFNLADCICWFERPTIWNSKDSTPSSVLEGDLRFWKHTWFNNDFQKLNFERLKRKGMLTGNVSDWRWKKIDKRKSKLNWIDNFDWLWYILKHRTDLRRALLSKQSRGSRGFHSNEIPTKFKARFTGCKIYGVNLFRHFCDVWMACDLWKLFSTFLRRALTGSRQVCLTIRKRREQHCLHLSIMNGREPFARKPSELLPNISLKIASSQCLQ